MKGSEMTDKQRMYFDLLLHGYSLEEIACMTRRTVNSIRTALEGTEAKDCGHKVYRRREPGGGRYSY